MDTAPAPAPARDRIEPEAGGGPTWRTLLMWSTIWSVLVIVLVNAFGGIIPPLLVFAALLIAGAIWLRRATKGPAILLLIVFLLYVAMSAPFIIPTLAVPASAGDFILNVAMILGAAAAIIAAIFVLRGRGAETSGVRTTVVAAAAVFAVLSAVSIVALLGYEEAAAQEGDIELVTADIDFSESTIESGSGEVGVFVENLDPTLHTFTIDELDVDLAIPAGKAARVSFDAEPGTYRFYCVPHKEDMEGMLEVR